MDEDRIITAGTATAGAQNVSAVTPVEPVDPDTLPKTTGERYYDVSQFLIGKVWIMAITAGIAYIAKYGKESYGNIPNVFKQFQGWMEEKLLTNKIMPLEKHGETGRRIAGAVSNATVLFHGGTLFAPLMRSMENNKAKIAAYFNKRYGQPGEVEIGHERLKDDPHHTWFDILKGRVAAFAIVFTSFVSFDLLLGKHKGSGLYHFDRYEEGFARWLAGFAKAGKEIAKTPVTKALTKEQDLNKLYRFGKIAALDLYATTASITIWNIVSRSSAKKRSEKLEVAKIAPFASMETPSVSMRTNSGSFTDYLKPQENFVEMVAKKKPENSHAAQMESQAGENKMQVMN